MKNISKTDYINYRQCPKNLWLKIHKPELFSKYTLSSFEQHLMEQGNEVESHARNLQLFDGGVEVTSTGEQAVQETARLMTEKTPTLFQATFIADGFIVRNDMLSYDPLENSWNLFEVKATNSMKEGESERDHISDVAFQVEVMKRSNIKIGRYFLIHLDKEYKRNGALNMEALFTIEDITEQVDTKLSGFGQDMETARWYLSEETEPSGACDCVYLGRKKHCTTIGYSHPSIPEYSVHDLTRVSKKKMEAFIDGNIFHLEDIPPDMELSDNQKNQVLAHRLQKPLIEVEKIRDELTALTFPLYFLDYESYAPAVPIFDGFGTYQQVPFQFSLRILQTPESEMEHVEFLHEESSDPSLALIKKLTESVGNTGTVIAWYDPFEGMINRQLAERHPEYESFFENMNARLYDLMDIFQKQYYIHHGFRGSASIKKVLPTLLPELSYVDLDIHEGGQASQAWWTMISPSTSKEESKKIASDLKTYCGLDTYAMYAIWRYLHEKV